MAKTSPSEFFRQVRNESKKITWPNRQRMTVSMIAVVVMVTVSSIFLYFADQIIALVIRWLMGV